MFFDNNFNSNDTKLYDILNVDKSSTQEQIKKSYRKLALKYHPDRTKLDKTDAEEKFKEISMAYDILGDTEKREKYDKFGLDALKNMDSGQEGVNPFDLFGNIFGQNNAPQQYATPSRKEVCEITLEQLYNEETIEFTIKKQIICDECLGIGAKSRSSFISCRECNGTGQILKIMQIGPGFLSQTQTQCGSCLGKGKTIKPGEECMRCKTHRIIKKKTNYNIELKNTYSNGHEVVFKGEGDQHPDANVYGDLIVKLKCKSHDNFVLENNNLIYKMNISLIEALCGFKFNIFHLDNRILLLNSEEIIEPNMKKVILGEGVNPSGNLIIIFNILFPKNKKISDEKKIYIKKLLSNTNDLSLRKIITNNIVEKTMIEFIDAKTTNENMNESEFDDAQQENVIGCAQQ